MVEWISKLDTLSPLKTLTRGYSIVEKDGKMIKSIEDLNTNDKISIRLKDGEKQAEIL
jgi:exodeoxyribonuclease VII large subunit